MCNKIINMFNKLNTPIYTLIPNDEWNKIIKLINEEVSRNLKFYLIDKHLRAVFLEYEQFKIELLYPSNCFIHNEHIDYYNMKHSAIHFMFFMNDDSGNIEFTNNISFSIKCGSLLLYPSHWSYSYKICSNHPITVITGCLYVNDNAYAINKVENIIKQIKDI